MQDALVVEFLYNFTVNAINFDSSNSDLDISEIDICQDRVPNTVQTLAKVFAPYFGFEHIMIYSTDTVCWEKLSPSEDAHTHEYTNSDWVSVYVWVVSGVIALLVPLTLVWFVPKYKVEDNKLKKSSNLQVGFLYTVLDWGNTEDKAKVEEFNTIQIFRLLFLYTPAVFLILYPGIIVFNEFDDRATTAKHLQAFVNAGHINCHWHVFSEFYHFSLLLYLYFEEYLSVMKINMEQVSYLWSQVGWRKVSTFLFEFI